MERALRSILVNDSGVAALVGSRVSWVQRPQSQNALPAITLQRVSGARDYHMGGASGLVETRVQVDCFGASYASAKAVARAVVEAVSAYTGTVSGVTFQKISVDSERDDFRTESGADRHLFMTSLDLLIWHDE